MKKFFAISLLLIPLCVLADDTIEIDEPQWKDFAPKAFIEVNEPKGLAKFNDTAAYWYKRKTEFNNEIEKCREFENYETKFTCYQNLKVLQYQKNSDYNARLEAIERAKHMPQEIQDPTANMLPINSYLNNFSRFQPNELR